MEISDVREMVQRLVEDDCFMDSRILIHNPETNQYYDIRSVTVEDDTDVIINMIP